MVSKSFILLLTMSSVPWGVHKLHYVHVYHKSTKYNLRDKFGWKPQYSSNYRLWEFVTECRVHAWVNKHWLYTHSTNTVTHWQTMVPRSHLIDHLVGLTDDSLRISARVGTLYLWSKQNYTKYKLLKMWSLTHRQDDTSWWAMWVLILCSSGRVWSRSRIWFGYHGCTMTIYGCTCRSFTFLSWTCVFRRSSIVTRLYTPELVVRI